MGLLSCDEDLAADLTDLFNSLTGYARVARYRKILVAPTGVRDQVIERIRLTAERHSSRRPGRIVMQMNSLVDAACIRALYAASQAGVEIDLIVRGICRLRPGVPGVSEHIRVRSIVGRFLEHARVFMFANGRSREYYIGSADLMPRNLDQRVEAVTPVDDPDLTSRLQRILDVMLADNVQAWELGEDGTWSHRQPAEDEEPVATQKVLRELALRQGVEARRPGTRTPGRAALAVRGDCQKITSRPRVRVNTSWERCSRARSSTRSMAAPRRRQERTGTCSSTSALAGGSGHSPAAGWQ
jgi:polyphosphate kinase